MANQVKFYELWNPQNLIWGTIILLVVCGLIFYSFFYPQLRDALRLSDFDAETKGQLIQYQTVETLRQTKLGSEVVIEKYIVTYSYYVDGHEYNKTESIEGLRKYGIILDRLSDTNQTINILYKSTEPSKSTVDIEKK